MNDDTKDRAPASEEPRCICPDLLRRIEVLEGQVILIRAQVSLNEKRRRLGIGK